MQADVVCYAGYVFLYVNGSALGFHPDLEYHDMAPTDLFKLRSWLDMAHLVCKREKASFIDTCSSKPLILCACDLLLHAGIVHMLEPHVAVDYSRHIC